MSLTKQRVYIGDYEEAAALSRETFGKTDLYSTGHTVLDKYLGGGYGRPNAYEIVLLYGATGIGKSTVALNFLLQPIFQKNKIGLLVLEDDMADVSNRLYSMMGQSQYEEMNRSNLIQCLPADELVKSWSLADLLEYIEMWYTREKVELILLDHLQFAFENAEAIKGENEYTAQRMFMQKLNQLVKRLKKTIILISHINNNTQARGMQKIIGSSSIAAAATKVIEISENKDFTDGINIEMHKSRFTKRPGFEYHMKLKNGLLGKT